jgi:hypothetical protein
MTRRLALAIFFLCAACPVLFAQTPPEISITIEAADGALLVSGPTPLVSALDAALRQTPASGRTMEDTLRFIRRHYGNELKAETFAVSDVGNLPDVTVITLPLRQAVLEGWAPPLEGLEPVEIETLLRAFEIRAIRREAFDKMAADEKIAYLYGGAGPLLVYSGNGSYETVTLYLRVEPKDTSETGETGDGK